MICGIAQIALVIDDYDVATAFYCGKLGFRTAEDSVLPGGKRWVRLTPPGGRGSDLLLSRAEDDRQRAAIGNQAGGRVLLFLHTDDFAADYQAFRAAGVVFTEGPWDRPYGRVAVFKDPFGNRIDLIQPSGG